MKYDKEYYRMYFRNKIMEDEAYRKYEHNRQRRRCHNMRLYACKIRHLYRLNLPVPDVFLIESIVNFCVNHLQTKDYKDYEILEMWIKNDMMWEENDQRQDQIEKCIFLYFRYIAKPGYYAKIALKADEFIKTYWSTKDLRKLEGELKLNEGYKGNPQILLHNEA